MLLEISTEKQLDIRAIGVFSNVVTPMKSIILNFYNQNITENFVRGLNEIRMRW